MLPKSTNMKSLPIALLLLLCGLFTRGQISINITDISQHIGDSVTVCATVESMRYFENSNRKPTLLNLGAKFPNQFLTVLIWDDVRSAFPGNVDELLNKEICITGTVILFKEKPEIIVYHPGQLIMKKAD